MPKQPKQLDELFHEGLKDIYFAEKKILSALPKLAKAAESDELIAAFKKHEAETEEQVKRLDEIFEMIDHKPQGRNCPAIMGLVEEGQEIIKDYKDSPVLDAGLIGAADSVEHYEISRYGMLMVWAQELGMTNAAVLLNRTIQEELKMHSLLIKLAQTATREVQAA
jgi:ferritin-like metal-binding protein YciE